jgi:hypothetical protein
MPRERNQRNAKAGENRRQMRIRAYPILWEDKRPGIDYSILASIPRNSPDAHDLLERCLLAQPCRRFDPGASLAAAQGDL